MQLTDWLLIDPIGIQFTALVTKPLRNIMNADLTLNKEFLGVSTRMCSRTLIYAERQLK